MVCSPPVVLVLLGINPVLHVEVLQARTVGGDTILFIKLEIQPSFSIHHHLLLGDRESEPLTALNIIHIISGSIVRDTSKSLRSARATLLPSSVNLASHHRLCVTVGTGVVESDPVDRSSILSEANR